VQVDFVAQRSERLEVRFAAKESPHKGWVIDTAALCGKSKAIKHLM
jgi:hypothetical protein